MMMTHLTSRFEEALVYAAHLHAGQQRKATEIPYVAHLLSVTALVLEDGGDEDQAIAALLHDAVEDQGGLPTLDEIRCRFGDRVADFVDACTDTYETPKPPWRGRKETYIARLRLASPEVRRISLADKLHNARTILAALSQGKHDIWARFNGGEEGTLWYYHTLVEVYRHTGDDWMTNELARTVEEMTRRAGEAAR